MMSTFHLARILFLVGAAFAAVQMIAPLRGTMQPLGLANRKAQSVYAPSLDFSDARNSQYVPVLGL